MTFSSWKYLSRIQQRGPHLLCVLKQLVLELLCHFSHFKSFYVTTFQKCYFVASVDKYYGLQTNHASPTVLLSNLGKP